MQCCIQHLNIQVRGPATVLYPTPKHYIQLRGPDAVLYPTPKHYI